MAFALASGFAQTERLILVSEIWSPYRIGTGTDASSWTGIDMDVAREIALRTGIEVEWKAVPWSRCLEMVKTGQADMLMGVAWTEERSVSMTYVPTPYSVVRPVFYALRGKSDTLRKYADLKGKTIAQSRDSAYFDRFNEDGSLNKISVGDEETVLRMLTGGRVDVAIGTEPNIAWDIARFGMKGMVEPTDWQPGEITPLYIAMSNEAARGGVAERIDACVRGMVADGTINLIHERYK